MGLNKCTEADAIRETLEDLIDGCSLAEVLEELRGVCLRRLFDCYCYRAGARGLAAALREIEEHDKLRDAVETVAQRLEE